MSEVRVVGRGDLAAQLRVAATDRDRVLSPLAGCARRQGPLRGPGVPGGIDRVVEDPDAGPALAIAPPGAATLRGRPSSGVARLRSGRAPRRRSLSATSTFRRRSGPAAGSRWEARAPRRRAGRGGGGRSRCGRRRGNRGGTGRSRTCAPLGRNDGRRGTRPRAAAYPQSPSSFTNARNPSASSAAAAIRATPSSMSSRLFAIDNRRKCWPAAPIRPNESRSIVATP